MLAAPKTIAIVNLSRAEDAAQAAAKARKILDATAELRTILPGNLSRALEDVLPHGGPAGAVLSKARAALQASEEAFTGFRSRQAREELEKARRLLFTIAPTPPVVSMLADLSFRMAILHLREENVGLAMEEFRLLHRLAPGTEIDPIRYAPEIVSAFQRSQSKAGGMANATLSISATYDGAPVYIDGTLKGAAPLKIEVSPGSHIVSIAAPQYQALAKRIDVDPQTERNLQFDLQPRSVVTRALELRFTADALTHQPESLRNAAAGVAVLVGADVVLVILDHNDSPQAALYDLRVDRLTFSSPVGPALNNLLGVLIKTPRPTIIDPPTYVNPTPWFKTPYGVAIVGGGAVSVGLLGVLLLSGSSEDPQGRDWESRFDFPE